MTNSIPQDAKTFGTVLSDKPLNESPGYSDLLAVCETLVALADGQGNFEHAYWPMVLAARVALAKAKGQTHYQHGLDAASGLVAAAWLDPAADPPTIALCPNCGSENITYYFDHTGEWYNCDNCNNQFDQPDYEQEAPTQ